METAEHGRECLQAEGHAFQTQGSSQAQVCRHCGLVSLASSKVGYKSSRYSSKVHFSVQDYELALQEDSAGYRMSNQSYLLAREKMVRFILDKGRLLKMSLKTLHQAVFLMDAFCEKLSSFPPAPAPAGAPDKQLLIAAGSLLIGAKAGELDERIPFISKLKKYTDLPQFAPEEFKRMEVSIGETLLWDLQRSTFYSFLEMYLAQGVLAEDDLVDRAFLAKVQPKDADCCLSAEEGVRILAKNEQSRQPVDFKLLLEARRAPASGSPGTPQKPNFAKLSALPPKTRAELVKIFELYARDLSNLVLRECKNYWSLSKPAIAVAIILYTRSAFMDHARLWSPRIEGICKMAPEEVRTAFARIEEFVRVGSSPPTAEDAAKPANGKPAQSHHPAFSEYQSAGFLPEDRALKANNLNIPSTSSTSTAAGLLQPKQQGSDAKSRQPPGSSREHEPFGNRLRRIKPLGHPSPPKRLY